MNDEVKLKINVPMLEVGELEVFDNHIHDIVEEYSKMLFKEKDQILTQRIIMKQEKEIERLKKTIDAMIDNEEEYCLEINRLNNIINELEKWLKEEYEATVFDYHNAIEDVLDKIQELKGDGSNEKEI